MKMPRFPTLYLLGKPWDFHGKSKCPWKLPHLSNAMKSKEFMVTHAYYASTMHLPCTGKQRIRGNPCLASFYHVWSPSVFIYHAPTETEILAFLMSQLSTGIEMVDEFHVFCARIKGLNFWKCLETSSSVHICDSIFSSTISCCF